MLDLQNGEQDFSMSSWHSRMGGGVGIIGGVNTWEESDYSFSIGAIFPRTVFHFQGGLEIHLQIAMISGGVLSWSLGHSKLSIQTEHAENYTRQRETDTLAMLQTWT
jgi:hypothetical protein